MPFSVLDSAGNHKTTIGATKLDELDPPTDVTTLNASSTAHGLMPKADANAGHFYSSDGTQKQVPLASGVSGDLPVANLSNGTFTKLATDTSTGTVNNWAPSGLDGNSYIPWAGASDATFTGLAGGVVGQIVVVKNTGTKVAYFPHQSGSSSAGNKYTNHATSAPTPVAPRGFIAHQYDGTQWQMIGHKQGAWIEAPYAAGNFTASGSMTWGVDAGDVGTVASELDGTTLKVQCAVGTSTLAGTAAIALQLLIPGGFLTTARAQAGLIGLHLWSEDSGVTRAFGIILPTSTLLVLYKTPIANYVLNTNQTEVNFVCQFEVS